MLSTTQIQTTAVGLPETSAGKAAVSPEAGAAVAAPAQSDVAAAASSSTSVTLSVAAPALASVVQSGLLKDGDTGTQFINNALEALQSHDPEKKPHAKSRLEKMLQKQTLLELLDRWSMQREAEKKGKASNPEDIKLKLKNMEQLKDLT